MRSMAVSLVLCVLMSAAVGGQQPPPPPVPSAQRPLAGQGQAGADLRPAEIQRLLDGMMVIDARDALDLNDKQYADFIIRLRPLQETRRRNQQRRVQIMMELQRMTNPRNTDRADEGAIKQRLTDLQELDARATAELRKAYAAIDEVLNVRQQARFRVFEEMLERRRLELMQRVRQNLQQNRQQNRQQ